MKKIVFIIGISLFSQLSLGATLSSKALRFDYDQKLKLEEFDQKRLESIFQSFDQLQLPAFLMFYDKSFKTGPFPLPVEVNWSELAHGHYGFVAHEPNQIPRLELNWQALYDARLYMTFFHELAHLTRIQKGLDHLALEEGVGQLTELRLGQIVPWNSLDQLFYNSELPAFFEQWEQLELALKNGKSVDEQANLLAYQHSTMFMLYLYQQFGQDDFLRALLKTELRGAQGLSDLVVQQVKKLDLKISPDWLSFNSLYLNFALALGINQNVPSSKGMLSLRYLSFDQQIAHKKMRFRLAPWRREFKVWNLAPYSAKYLSFIANQEHCFTLEKQGSAMLFEVLEKGFWQMPKQLSGDFCLRPHENRRFILVNPGERSGQLYFRSNNSADEEELVEALR